MSEFTNDVSVYFIEVPGGTAIISPESVNPQAAWAGRVRVGPMFKPLVTVWDNSIPASEVHVRTEDGEILQVFGVPS